MLVVEYPWGFINKAVAIILLIFQLHSAIQLAVEIKGEFRTMSMLKPSQEIFYKIILIQTSKLSDNFCLRDSTILDLPRQFLGCSWSAAICGFQADRFTDYLTLFLERSRCVDSHSTLNEHGCESCMFYRIHSAWCQTIPCCPAIITFQQSVWKIISTSTSSREQKTVRITKSTA